MLINSHYKKYIHYYLILVFLVLHLSYINTPFVNYEWAYRIGSKAFETSNKNLFELYFYNQANPITYSFLSTLPLLLFGDYYASYRILALLGGILLLISLKTYGNQFLIIIVGLNPLIWIYSGRAYSEMISVGVLMLALGTNTNGIFKGILGILSAMIKYHSIVVSCAYWGLKSLENFFMRKPIVWLDKNFLAAVICIIGLFTFFLVYNHEFGIWIIPDQFKKTHSFVYLNSINNFFSYGFYLGAMFFLTIPYLLKNTNLFWQIVAILISIPPAVLFITQGEMDFGSFNQLLRVEIIFLIKIFGFWNFLLCCKFIWNDKKLRSFLLTVILYITILSFTRPAQRYLIFVIPFWAIMICLRLEFRRVVQVGYVIILCGINLFATLYQIQNARASSEIAVWSQSKGLQINSGEIYPHVGEISNHDPKSKITITMNPKLNDKILFSRAVKIFNYPIKKYFVIEPIDSF